MMCINTYSLVKRVCVDHALYSLSAFTLAYACPLAGLASPISIQLCPYRMISDGLYQFLGHSIRVNIQSDYALSIPVCRS